MAKISNIRFSSTPKDATAACNKELGSNGQHPPEPCLSDKFYLPNDTGRAKRFVDRYSNDIRFVPEQDCWLVWNGKRWQVNTDGAIERLAKTMCQEMFGLAINNRSSAQNEAIREAVKYGDRRNIQNYLHLARSDKRIILKNECLIPQPWIVAAQNGIIDLKTGEIRDYSRNDVVMHTLGCEVDANAD
jgi:phage/plasmid-associated DNA primase